MNINKWTYSGGKVKWRARYPDPARGGRKQIERQFDSKRDAERWLTDQKSAIRRGEHVDPRENSRLFRELVADWEATWIELEPRTQVSYRSILRRHVMPRWSEIRISAITPYAVQTWIGEIASRRHSGTVRHVYFVFRSILRLAVERRYLVANPCDSVRIPRAAAVAGGPQVILTAEEVQTLAKASEGQYCVLIYVAAYGGLRAGELGARSGKKTLICFMAAFK